MIDKDNKINVIVTEDNKGILEFDDYNIKTNAYIGKNGITTQKREGDGKTPLGEFELGIILGTHDKLEITSNKNFKYNKITKNMYWIDDSNSKYYNQLVDITKVEKDWKSAEHLIDYPIQYEYLVEIKTNPSNMPKKGSAIFLHCIKNTSTEGCIAIDRESMKEIIVNINEDTKINIRKK